MPSAPGVVTISLDTELAWGCFDTVGVSQHADAYANTRSVIDRLCDLFGTYDVSATWALVAHLLDDCRADPEAHADMVEPGFDWIDDWSNALPCQTGVDRELWYGPDVLETIRTCATSQEVGLHGYSHMVLDEAECRPDAARTEIERAVAVADAAGIDATSFVYPRNGVGYQRVLAEHGIETYRSRNAEWFERRPLPARAKKGLRFADELLTRAPPVVTPTAVEGLVAIPGSQVFRPYHGGWQYTPPQSQVTRARKGIARAAETGDVFHLWFHPFNLALEPDRLLAAFERVLSTVSEHRRDGTIEVLTMGEVATQFRDGRWTA